MPFYNLKCNSCGKEFEAYATVTERGEGQIKCPDCGGVKHGNVMKKGANIIVKKDGGGCPHAGKCGCGCSR
jgi:putative FmdB family regulatory protein